jgi:hypothetical protein
MHPLLNDPWVASEIERGLEKHKGALTPAQLDALREQLAHTFATHPAAQRVLERCRPTDRSGTRGTGREAPAEEQKATKEEGKP